MSNLLYLDMLRFSLSKVTAKEKIKYIVLSTVFYFFLAKTFSQGAVSSESTSNSQAGDDIYPLF